MRTLFLCFMLFSGNLFASSSIQETINTDYSPWSLSAFSLIIAEADQTQAGGSLFSYNYIGPNYRLNNNERLAFKLPFLMNTAGHDRFNGQCVQDQDAELADPFVNYSNYDLVLLPGDIDVYWDGRVYLPLSKASRKQKMIGRLRSNFIFSRRITQALEVEWRNEFNYYHQSQTTYVASGINDQCEVGDNAGPSNTRRFAMDNWINIWYRLDRKWSLGLVTIFTEEVRNTSGTIETSRQRNGRMKEISVSMGPSVKWIANDNVSFIGTVSDRIQYSGFHPLSQDNLADLGKFKKENVEVTLSSFIRF